VIADQKMPTQGVLLQPKATSVVEVTIDDSCDRTIIKSDDDADGTEIDSEIQSDEEWDGRNEVDMVDHEEYGVQDDNHLGRAAIKDDIRQDALRQPKMLQAQLSEANLERLGLMMGRYEGGSKSVVLEQSGWENPLLSIAFMALLAEKLNIWGAFLILAVHSSEFHRWQQEIATLYNSAITRLPT
jgi:hypothetical protein